MDGYLESNRKLFVAVKSNNVELIQKALRQGANVNACALTDRHMTALRMACDCNHAAAMAVLLAVPGIDVDRRDGWGRTPLFRECNSKAEYALEEMEKIRMLLAANADPNAESDDRDTPLTIACFRGCLDVVKLLLRYSNNTDSTKVPSHDALHRFRGQRGGTLLHAVCRAVDGNSVAHLSTLQYLLDCAASSGSAADVLSWLKAVDDTGKSPLHEACINDNLKVVALILQQVQKFEQQLEQQQGRRGKVDISNTCTWLLAHDNNGLTPIHWACRCGNLVIAKYLLDYVSKDEAYPASALALEATDSKGNTPLCKAAECGKLEVAKELVSRRANILVRKYREQNTLRPFRISERWSKLAFEQVHWTASSAARVPRPAHSF